MGILDGFQFDPSTYNGGAAVAPGWLGLLLGGGVPFDARARTDAAPAPFPSVDLPQNAAPTSGALPAQPPAPQPGGIGSLFSGIGNLFGPSQANAQPAPQQAPELGMGDRLGAGLANFASGHGLLGGISGLVSGLSSGVRTDPAGMLMQQQASTYRALVGAGVPPAVAQAAALNPEVMKTIAPELYQKPQLIDAGTNPLTGEKYHQLYNPNNQRLSNLSPSAEGTTGGLTAANAAAVGLPPMVNSELAQIQNLNQSGTTGDEYYSKLKTINPAFADKVKSMANGDLPYPSGFIMKTPYGSMLTDAISALKPGVTAQDYGLKQKNRAYWASGGAGAAEIKAINTAIVHATKLSQISDEMGGTDYAPGVSNAIIQGAKVAMGDKQFQDAQREWDATSETLATEVSKALNGGKPNVADKEHWRQIFSNTSGPTQRTAAIKAAMAILQGRTVTQAQNYEQGMGSLKDPMEFISPENQQNFERLQAGLPVKGKEQQASPQGQLPKVSSPAQAAKLPRGTHFLDPNGIERIVP